MNRNQLCVRRGLMTAGVFAAAGINSVATAQTQILENHTSSITTYLTGATPLQQVLPLHTQRGVNIDGTLRLPPSFAWSIAGNALGDAGGGGGRLGDLMLAIGSVSPTEVDWVGANPGASAWVIGRSFNQLQASVSKGPQGNNWFQSSQPEIKIYTGGSGTDDVLYLVYGADRYIEFDRTGNTDTTYKSKNGAAGIFDYVAGTPDTYIYYDQHGTRVYFFGGDTSSGRADWQIWKIVDAAGNISFVGDSATASTAASNGYNADKTINLAFDAAPNGGRRYTHSYTSVDGYSRLTEVKVETKTGGTWASSPTGVVEVARISYAYYTATVDDEGAAGDLKLVTIRTSLTDSGSTLGSGVYMEKKKYYRYYTRAWSNSDGRRGNAYDLKMVVDFEGTRKYDWDQDSLLDDDFLSGTEAALKPYASAFYEYPDSDHRPSKAFFNGECGCGGGTNGIYELTYTAASGWSGTSGYDTAWYTRTVVKQPDGTYFTQYFDETMQPLSRVVTSTDPAVSVTTRWVTEVVRNAGGQVTEIHTPANITGYTHTNGSVAYTRSSSVGLITYLDRVTSVDMTGFPEATYVKQGTSGTAEYTGYTGFSSSDYKFTDTLKVIRPLPNVRRSYHTSGSSVGTSANFNETAITSTVWGPDNTYVKNLALKQITTTLPAVTGAKNGRDSVTPANDKVNIDRYLREDGTTAYAKEPVFADDSTVKAQYTAITAEGLPDNRVGDVKSGSSFLKGDSAGNWSGLTLPGGGADALQTQDPAYDAQGRPDTSIVPNFTSAAGTRVTKNYYSRLKDGRMVAISCPNRVAGTPTYYGPLNYTVTNHAGRVEFSCVLGIGSGGITTALTSWIDETVADPIDALDSTLSGSSRAFVSRVSTNVHSNAGNQLNESRFYVIIAASSSWIGSAGTDYDATYFGYDTMGRRKRVKDATGTIDLNVFDALGRATSRQTGTNDPDEGGGDDMVTVEETQFDGGSSGGNSHVTRRRLHLDDSGSNYRDTIYEYDYRGHLLLTTNPLAPHVLTKYDNLGRAVATGMFSSTGSIVVGTDDPTTETANRVGLSQTFYDEQGHVWKTQRHKIDQSDGSDDDTILNLTWYDAAGRVIKIKGEGGMSKTVYDRLGRATNRYVLADDGSDSTYALVAALTSDKVLEESQTWYDTNTGLALVQASISRFHNDTSGTGALDSNADASATTLTDSNLGGRLSATAMYYDVLGRLTDTAAYGSNGFDGTGNETFTRPSSVASRSDTELVTTNTFNDNGTLLEVSDPKSLETRYTYDVAQRKVAEIKNYVNGTPSSATGDDDVYTRFKYDEGHIDSMWVDVDGDNAVDGDDQVTTYTYGVTKGGSAGDSKIGSGRLLWKTTYPDSSSGSDLVTTAYNAQGQEIWKKDQGGTIIETDYDAAGRVTHRRASTIAGGLDTTIKRISTVYLSRGLTDTVTQYDHATVGSGTAKDQVQYSYDAWGNLTKFEQDADSTIAGGSGRPAFDVQYAWSKLTPSNAAAVLARSTMSLPNGDTLTYGYGSGVDASASRVASLTLGSTVVAEYAYVGMGHLVSTTLPEPGDFDLVSRAYDPAGTVKAYSYLDRFNRVLSSRWHNSNDENAASRGFYRTDLAYDRNSNILSADDVNLRSPSNDKGLFDALYTNDNMNRLSNAREGHYASSDITTGDRSREEAWTGLTQTGNWERRKLDLNGDGDYTDSGEIDDTGAFNKANEWNTRDTDSNSSVNYTLTHDAVGNMTDDGKGYKYTYDAFGRVVTVKNQSNNVVSEYKYNGLGYKIGWHYDTDADGTVESGSPGDDPWYWFCHDERWRAVATYRYTDEVGKPKELFVFHAAGARGLGGSSYIDSVILRDRDANTAWSAQGDGVAEERIYYGQNWRADVSVLWNVDGTVLERVKYSAYGVPTSIPMGDYNADGVVNGTDSSQFNTDFGNGNLRADMNADGGVDFTDQSIFGGATGGGCGRGVQSVSGVANRIGYAGYQWDPSINANHVRHRVFVPELGRWTRRDPIGYLVGPSLLEYVVGRPILAIDPLGLDFLFPPITSPTPFTPPAVTPTPVLIPTIRLVCRTGPLGVSCVLLYCAYEICQEKPDSLPKPITLTDPWTDIPPNEYVDPHHPLFCERENLRRINRQKDMNCMFDTPCDRSMPRQTACFLARMHAACAALRSVEIEWHENCPGGTPRLGHYHARDKYERWALECQSICDAHD